MRTVKVLAKGQITLPKELRKSSNIKEGDTLVIEKVKGNIVLKKGKTIFDFSGALPGLGMTIEKLREKAVKEAAKDRG